MKVYAWPDGNSVEEDEYSETEYSFLGDDFMIITIPDDVVDIDNYVLSKVNGKLK